MPEVNLLKDTENLTAGKKKAPLPTAPELTNPKPDTGQGLGGRLKSLFNRGPKTMPVAPSPTPLRAMGSTAPAKGTSGERILSETKHAASAMIPLPEDSGGFNVNLLSEDLVTTVNTKQRGIMLGVFALGAIVVVGLVYAGLLAYQGSVKSDIQQTKTKLSDLDQQITKLKTEQNTAATTVQKLNAIRTLIDRHTRWTKFFALLERYTLPDVTYGPAFSGDIAGSVSLTATTTSYERVAQQYLIFQQLVHDQRFISAFSITGATSSTSKDGQTHATFTVVLTLMPNDFTMSEKEFKETFSANAATDAKAGLSALGISAVTSKIEALSSTLAAVEQFTAAVCALYDQPSDVAFVPDFAQADMAAGIAAGKKPAECTTIAQETKIAARNALITDSDADTVDLLFEQLYGTVDTAADSGKGQPDYNYIKQRYQSEQTSATQP